MESAQAEGRPWPGEPGAGLRVGGLVGGGPVATKTTPIGVTGAVAMELPGLGRPTRPIPMGKATVTGPVVEGGAGGPPVLAPTLTVGRVVRQATVPVETAIAEGMRRARVAVAPGSANRPNIVDVSGRRGEVAKDVLTGPGAPAVVEMAATPALAMAPSGPEGHVGPIHAVGETIPRVGPGKAGRRVLEVAPKGPIPETAWLVASQPIASLQAALAALPRTPTGDVHF